MSKQVTLSKFFATSNSTSSGRKFVTDDETKLSYEPKNKKQTPKRKSSPNVSESAKPTKKLCVNNDMQEEDNDDISIIEASTSSSNRPSEERKPSGVLASSTLKKLSEFSSDVDPTISYTEIKNKCHESYELANLNKSKEQPKRCDTTASDDDVDMIIEDDEEEHKNKVLSKFAACQSKTKAPIVNRSTRTKYTPLEQQFMEIKAKCPDSVLFVECGYKYRFFGEDAETAAQVLKIFAHPDHNFMTASIPTHRLFVHVRRLVAAGYKVGVVKQTETAALKAAGSNKSAPFTRKLTALYTKSTLIGEDVDPLSGIESGSEMGVALPNNYLMCVCDAPAALKKTGKHTIGIVAVDPGTGDVIHDVFEDTDTRTELERRIAHIQPVEMLLPETLSPHTEKLISDVVALSSTDDDRIRLERLGDDNFLYSQAFETVSGFYTSSSSSLQLVINLPKCVVSCLSALIVYLKDFHLQTALQLTSNFSEFSTKSKYMQLTASTVRNLELFHNATNQKERASLFWVLNHTVTKFGCRMVRRWLSCPLADINAIRERLDAVEELSSGSLDGLVKFRNVLAKMPDLEKGLCSVYYKKCSTGEFYVVVKAMERILKEVKSLTASLTVQIKSSLLQTLLSDLPQLLQDVTGFSRLLHEKAARENDKPNMFVDESRFPKIRLRKSEIVEVEKELKEHLRDVRLTVKQPSLNYVTVLQTEFLVEVRNTQLKLVPSDWTKISSTKAVSRFHTPYIVRKYKELNQLREHLVIDATDAWINFLQEFSEHYLSFKRGVEHLATLDCLLSLSRVAQQHGYTRPVLVEEICVDIDQGRHPVIDVLKGDDDQFVPNDTRLQSSCERVMIITGPNMGGKSSYIRQVALITIMAQIGSFVPANYVKLGVLDAIYTRMGASDDIFKGRSTFMVELEEASDIMKYATERSLVILDELGRGTSTHDGVAIAYATLDFFIKQTKSLTLFVTHYPMLSEFETRYPDVVGNYHMSFLLHEEEDSEDVLTFLYQLVGGVAGKSYGMNVARLADIPSDIIKVAMEKSTQFEDKEVTKRKEMEVLFACFSDETAKILQVLKAECS